MDAMMEAIYMDAMMDAIYMDAIYMDDESQFYIAEQCRVCRLVREISAGGWNIYHYQSIRILLSPRLCICSTSQLLTR
jgi:hypothetical protein